MIIIDDTEFDIPIKRLICKGEVLDKYAERTNDGKLHREIIGVYFNYQLEFARSATNTTVYSALWQKLTEPEEFHTVTLPDEDGNFTFEAYISNVGHELVKDKETQKYWKNLTANFIAREPARS